MKHWIIWTPLALFIGFFALASSGLITPRDTTIESQLVGQPVPEFSLQPAFPGRPGVSSSDLATGEPRLVNFFASWCAPCAVESPQLIRLHNAGVKIDAIAVRDTPEALQRFLETYGDPFDRIGADVDSSAQFAMGASGVPETYLVDGQGIIRMQHIGEIRPEDVDDILAAVEAAR